MPGEDRACLMQAVVDLFDKINTEFFAVLKSGDAKGQMVYDKDMWLSRVKYREYTAKAFLHHFKVHVSSCQIKKFPHKSDEN